VTDEPKREFIEYIVNKHILPATNIAFDAVNYERAGVAYPGLPEKYETKDDYLKAFRAVSKPGTPFFSLINDYNANVAYMRIRLKNGKDLAISIVINRWHNNVTHLFGEGASSMHQRTVPILFTASSDPIQTTFLMSVKRTCPTFLISLPILRKVRKIMSDWPSTASTERRTGSGIRMTGFKSDSMRMNP
jgi:hypothetical protein